MSASKKKRLGSQRRSLNQNVKQSPETSDTATSPPVPQARQRADAKADLTLSPGNAQSETSARKKNLGSQRGNKGNLQFKDVTTESSNKPTEEVEDATPHAPASDPVDIKNESSDESLERNIKAAGSNLNEASTVSLSPKTETTSQISDFPDTKMDTRADVLLHVAQSEKYLTEIAHTEEGVITEKDQAQQMPGIFEATIPVGVSGESTGSDKLIEHEETNIIGSHDHNKHNTEEKAGPIEKPVCQESDKSSLPIAKPRKMGSSRKKREINLKDVQDQGNEMAVQSNISAALEPTGLTIADTTREINDYVSATEVTYKQDSQVQIKMLPKAYEEKTDSDDLSDVASANLSEVKESEEAHIENVLVEMKAQGDQIMESKLRDEQLVCLQNTELSELSFVDIPPTNDTNALVTSPHHFVTTTAVGDVEEAKMLETGENVTLQVCNKSDERNKDITNKDILKGDSHPKDDASFNNFATDEENKERSEKDVKDETLDSCNLTSELISKLESDKSPVTELTFTEDETITELSEPIFSAQPGVHPFTEGLLHLHKKENDLLNDTKDREASSSVCMALEENSLVESVDSKNINIIEQPEPLISFNDGESIVPGQVCKGEDQDKDVNLSDEQLEQKEEPFEFSLQNPQSVDNAPLSTSDVSLNDYTYLKENSSFDFYANEQDSDQSSVTKDISESSSESLSSTNYETFEPMFAALQELKPTTEGILPLDQNKDDVLNISATTENTSADKNETDVAQSKDVLEISSSSVSDTLEDKNINPIGLSELDEAKLVFKTNTEDAENVELLGQQSESLVSFTDGLSTDSNEPYKEEDEEETKLSHEQLVDLPSEPERPLNPQTAETDAPLTSLFPDIAASVDDASAIWDKSTPEILVGSLLLGLENTEKSMNNKDQPAGPDNIDKAPIQVHESTDNEDMNYTSKPTEEVGIVEIKDISDTPKSSEPQLFSETTGEPFEKLDVEVNAPDTDPHHSPVRRKFGSSRRSKARKDVAQVTTVDDDEALSARNENLPSIIDVQIDEQKEPIKKEENIKTDDAEVRELLLPNEEMEWDQRKENLLKVEANILGLDENLSKIADDGSSQPTSTSNQFISSDKDEDKMKVQRDESPELFTVQIPHTDAINGAMAPTQPDAPVSLEDGSVVGSQLIQNRGKLGSSRRIKGRRQDNDELKPEEINIMHDGKSAKTKIEPVIVVKGQDAPIEKDVGAKETLQKKVEPVQSPEIHMDNENQAAVQNQSDKSCIQVHDEALVTVEDLITNDEFLKPTEVTVLEAEQTTDEPKDNTEQSDINTESYTLKDTINVHQLTYISDSETHEEMDNSTVQQAKHSALETVGEPFETVKLINTEVNTSDSDSHHGLRKKLGSSRRVKERKLEVVTTDSKDTLPNDNEDGSQVPEVVEARPDFLSELETEPMIEGSFTKSEDTELFLLSDKDQTVDSTQDKEIENQAVSFEEKTIMNIQKEIPEVVGDSFSSKDLKDKGNTEEKGFPRAVDVDNTSSQSVARSEDIISAKIDDALQSVVMSSENIAKEQEVIKVMEDSEAIPKLQINSEQKRRKMGSTRRSQVNRKQQDEERNPEDNATLSVKATTDEKDYSPTVSEDDVQPLPCDISVNQGEATSAAGLVKDPHQSEESTETQEVAQEEKDKILQTDTELVEDLDKGAMAQTLLPIGGEEIKPSSPGKRRKMGSTRKNLSTKSESPQEGTVSPVNLEQKVASISNDNDESKEHSGLLAHTATVHQPLPDEETPLSPQVSQEKLRSESKETELSSQLETMAEDAAVARRRKMGSHRKPHSDQSIMQRSVKDSKDSLHHPLGEHRAESPKLTQLSEVNMGDNKALSSATAFNIKLDSRPVSEQPPLPSINVHRVQQSNIRVAAGFDHSANRYEVVMIGDSSVGKTSFIQRAQSGKFSPDVPASIGMDSYKWTVVVNGKTIVLHLWDTAGQERFRSMTKQIFHRAQAFLLMYDVTCAQTFTAVSYWANCIKDGAAENVVVLLLGNKSDRTERKVRREEGEILAEENSFAFMECSAATGENVVEALETVARLLAQKADRSEEPLMLRKPEPKNKSGCC